MRSSSQISHESYVDSTPAELRDMLHTRPISDEDEDEAAPTLVTSMDEKDDDSGAPQAASLMDVCLKCKRPTGETDCIICEECGRGMHILCLDKQDVPPGDWFCPACVFVFDGATAQDYEKWLESHQLRNLIGQSGAFMDSDAGKLRLGRFVFPTPEQYNQARATAHEVQVVAISTEDPPRPLLVPI